MRKHEAVVLGNGPSLRGFDFRRLARFDVFGMNAAYRYWYEINWFPQYYSCLDLVLGVSHRDGISELIKKSDQLGIRGFLLRQNLIDELGAVAVSPKVFNFDLLQSRFESWLPESITTGSHTCAWASILGYKDIYLLGIDCNYQEILPNAEQREGLVLEIVADAPNPNYFFDSYQKKGDKYHIPNPVKDLHLDSWRNVGEKLSISRVLNANFASKVDKFPFARFDDIEKGGRVAIYSPAQIIDRPATGGKLIPAGDVTVTPTAPLSTRSNHSRPTFSYDQLFSVALQINRTKELTVECLNFFVLACGSRVLADAEKFLLHYRENDQFCLACQAALRFCGVKYSQSMRMILELKQISLSGDEKGQIANGQGLSLVPLSTSEVFP